MGKPQELADAEWIEGVARRYGTTPWDVVANAPMWLDRHMRVLEMGRQATPPAPPVDALGLGAASQAMGEVW